MPVIIIILSTIIVFLLLKKSTPDTSILNITKTTTTINAGPSTKTIAFTYTTKNVKDIIISFVQSGPTTFAPKALEATLTGASIEISAAAGITYTIYFTAFNGPTGKHTSTNVFTLVS